MEGFSYIGAHQNSGQADFVMPELLIKELWFEGVRLNAVYTVTVSVLQKNVNTGSGTEKSVHFNQERNSYLFKQSFGP